MSRFTAPPKAKKKAPQTLQGKPSLERLVDFVWGSDFSMSPVQRAICRVSDGSPLGDLWDRDDVQATFGGARPPEERPDQLVVIGGVRSGKTLVSAGIALLSAMTCDLGMLAKGERALVPMLAVRVSNAKAVFDFTLEAALKLGIVVANTADTIVVRHVSGAEVEIAVKAGSRAGTNVVSRWLAALVVDEFCYVPGADESVVALEDVLSQASGRMLPGAQICLASSPHAPSGPGYRIVQGSFGEPSKDRVVAWTIGPEANPHFYNETHCEKLKRTQPGEYAINCTRTFRDPDSGFLDPESVRAIATLEGPVPPVQDREYVAAMDPATRGNAWTLVILDSPELGSYRVVLAREWKPPKGSKLSPKAVLGEIAVTCRAYGIDTVRSDQRHFDSLFDLADEHGLYLRETRPDPDSAFPLLDVLIHDQRLVLPNDDALINDLTGIRKKLTVRGVSYDLPRGRDGRHGDYVPSLLRCIDEPPNSPSISSPQQDDRDEFELAFDEALAQAAEEGFVGEAYRRWNQ